MPVFKTTAEKEKKKKKTRHGNPIINGRNLGI